MNKAFEKIIERLILESSSCKVYKIINPNVEDVAEFNTYKKCIEIVKEVAAEYNGGWIPVKTRPMTEEEKENYSEYLFEGDGLIYECPLPDDGQEVLITSKYGSVDKTTFYTDCGNYFEDYEDYDEVIAWKPLPEPFKERD